MYSRLGKTRHGLFFQDFGNEQGDSIELLGPKHSGYRNLHFVCMHEFGREWRVPEFWRTNILDDKGFGKINWKWIESGLHVKKKDRNIPKRNVIDCTGMWWSSITILNTKIRFNRLLFTGHLLMKLIIVQT